MFHITVDWSPTTGGAHTLLGYYIHKTKRSPKGDLFVLAGVESFEKSLRDEIPLRGNWGGGFYFI